MPEASFKKVVVADVRGEPEGLLRVRAHVVLPDPKPDDPTVEAFANAVVDRTPAAVDWLLPPENGLACLASTAGAEALTLRVVARDVSPELEIAGAAVRPPGGAFTALRRVCAGEACERPFVARGVPSDLVWDARGQLGGDHDLRVAFCDRAGNVTSVERRLTLTRPAKPRVVSVAPNPFSPNADGRADAVTAVFRLAEAARVSAAVHQGSPGGPVVRSLVTGQFQLASDVSVTWDGVRDDARVADDGPYSIVLSAESGCASVGGASAEVLLDRTPPEVGVASPAAGQRVRASVDVSGHVTDEHLAFWRLEAACGAAEPVLIAMYGHRIGPEGRIAAWDTSRSSGSCALRLSAEDRAQNRAAAESLVEVERGGFIGQLVASPDLFSPNGDGRRETTTIRYELASRARTRLEIRRGDGSTLRVLAAAGVRDGGGYEIGWDGLDAGAAPVGDGDYLAWLRAESPDDATVYEEQTVRVLLDKTKPALAVSRPIAGAYVPADARVQGSVADAHLLEYVLSVTPGGGAAVELARDSRPRSDAPLASLAQLSDGPHALTLSAEDLAENRESVTVAFQIDSGPPAVDITSPADQAVLARGEAKVPVTGRVEDANLLGWSLRFGAGAEPVGFGSIAEGAAPGSPLSLGAWDVRALPDGPYTLSLVATDRGSLRAESRVSVTLDGTPPEVSFSHPTPGAYVTAPGPIRGSVTDASLEGWLLEAAPGAPAEAYQWEPIASGRATIEDGLLADWSPLPPDGPYTLKLTGSDKVGLKASARVGVVVDTTPPATPIGLAAHVTRVSDTHGRVRIGWTANTEPDLAGYVVRRDEAERHAGTHASAAWDDGERLEGRYVYTVVAVDHAGNRSAPARLPVRVDVTPPAVSFSSPVEDAAVSGAVEVRGTAFSADDFAEYRLLVGAGEAPSSWTLLQRSTLPVAAGRLGEWLALADGSYQLALEAEDTNGNAARATRLVVVDTEPPGPPVLTAVVRGPAPDALRPEWEPGPSTDVVGHLVYRNGRLANATSLVLGDLAAYAVPGRAYQDSGLPDGRHCYRVVTLDRAGISSPPSNEICELLDNRAPAAAIVQPVDGSRFGQPVRVVAATPDLDVAQIRFELRAMADAAWLTLGTLTSVEGQPIPPWELTLDPAALGLAQGDYALRAVATDRAALSDPNPAAITVTYGDTTPPPAPLDLLARVDGADVGLSWTASAAPDFASYRVYRDGQRLAEALAEPRLTDAGLAPETYEYTVTALDADGNESAPSAPASAVVYAPRLDEPDWPIVSPPVATLTGDGARQETTLRVLRAGTPVAAVPGAPGRFRVDDVPLVSDGNLLAARGEDAVGNRSMLSNEIVLISNEPPGPVSDLHAAVAGREVRLSWTPVAAPDHAGYVVRRDGLPLTRTLPQTAAAGIKALGGFGTPASAFDGNPDTAWPAFAPATGEWTVRFAAPVLVAHVRVRFADSAATSRSYSLLAEWQGRYLTLARVRGNGQLVAEHRLPSAFSTSGLRIVLETPGQLAEVSIDRIDALPPDVAETSDTDVPDGRHRYEVVAIDRYGAFGPAAEVEAGVGDVSPPAPPTGLVATPEGRDVRLVWDPTPEPDVVRYAVLRDGARIGSSEAPAYRDPGLANGTYVYTVIALDRGGLESGESAPASATIALEATPPARPVILEPTDAAHPITLFASRTDVAGRSQTGTTVELELNGVVRGAAPVQPGFGLAARVARQGYASTLSPDGRLQAWFGASGTIVVQGLAGGDRAFDLGGGIWTGELFFSPDGNRLAFERFVSGSGLQLAVLDLGDGSVRPLADEQHTGLAWSPDGALLARARWAPQGTLLETLDVASGASVEIERSSGSDRWLRWSPDGRRLAFLRSWSGGAAELRVVALDSGETQVLDAQPWPDAPPAWSPDGTRLAWTSASAAFLRVRLHDVAHDEPAGEVTEPQADAANARFSPDGDWLSYVRIRRPSDGAILRTLVARQLASGFSNPVGAPRESSSWPEDHEWRGGRLGLADSAQFEFFAPEPGRFLLPLVPLQPGENLLVARATDTTSGLTSPDSEAVLVTVPQDPFPDLVVASDGLLLAPSVAPVGREVHIRVRVDNVGRARSEAATLALRVAGPSGSVLLEASEIVPALEPEASVWLSVPWTADGPGPHSVRAVADEQGEVAESDETNNAAERTLFVVNGVGLAAEIGSDHARYQAGSRAAVRVVIANSGAPFEGVARTTVEEPGGGEVALLDEREVSLAYSGSVELALTWDTAATRAGRYAFRVRVRAAGETTPAASAERVFDIEPGLSVLARVRPQPVTVAEGAPARFALSVDNRSTNAVLEGALARLRVQLEGASGPATFETVRALPSLLPGGTWEALDSWPSARPAGRYAVRFEVEKGGAVLAAASAVLTIVPALPAVAGTLAVVPGDVLAGEEAVAQLTLENRGTGGVAGYPLLVDVVAGPEATLHASMPSSVDLAAGESRPLTVEIATSAIACRSLHRSGSAAGRAR